MVSFHNLLWPRSTFPFSFFATARFISPRLLLFMLFHIQHCFVEYILHLSASIQAKGRLALAW